MSTAPSRRGDALRPVRRPWRSSLVLVCRECDGQKGWGPKRVRRALRQLLRRTTPAKAVRVAMVSCVDVCPKRAVTVVVVGVGERAVTVNGPRGLDRLAEELAEAIDRS